MYVCGLMSGTSVDAIDAAVVKITVKEKDLSVSLVKGASFAYPEALRKQILAVGEGASLTMAELADLDDAIAQKFAEAVDQIQSPDIKIDLIGSHGQTVFHRPPVKTQDQLKLGYSQQLGRGELIAYLTSIPTVSNFRAADIAMEGHGAPLVPKVDAYLFSDPHLCRCVQNLGGIGNVAYLPPREELNWENKICGWDTGPSNVLIDLAVQKLTNGQQKFDQNGQWASQGIPCENLINQWLKHDFFQQQPPKSTGRELFGQGFLEKCWQDALALELSTADWLATLTELTVASIVESYQNFLPRMPDQLILCGGGSKNLYLKERLELKLAPIPVLTTDELGISSQFKEAIAFAVLGYWRFCAQFPGNLPQVTGARQPMLLGDIHAAYHH